MGSLSGFILNHSLDIGIWFVFTSSAVYLSFSLLDGFGSLGLAGTILGTLLCPT